jgi:hypothetical protein
MAFEQNASVVTVYRSMVTPDITPANPWILIGEGTSENHGRMG